MDLSGLFAAPLTNITALLGYVVPFIVVMSFIVFFHELGHFAVARRCGVKVEVFSIGFGREIFGWYDRHGTRWRVAWVPLGGYVRFKGDADPASTADAESPEIADPDSFHAKPLWQRALIVAAGPVANFILAIAIFAGMYMTMGVQVLEPVVDRVLPDSAAAEAGFRPGDRIVAVDGRRIDTFGELRQYVAMRGGERLTFEVLRDGERIRLVATPRVREVGDGIGGKVRVGVLGIVHDVKGGLRYERKGPVEAVALAAKSTWDIVSSTMIYLKRM
ncbi:MAG TPA: RIP metalloprotease RseP, partial [Thermopetrobacter sp.]|nr:RIP metalloprotease RseP [Thermopetrobacter sp.]